MSVNYIPTVKDRGRLLCSILLSFAKKKKRKENITSPFKDDELGATTLIFVARYIVTIPQFKDYETKN